MPGLKKQLSAGRLMFAGIPSEHQEISDQSALGLFFLAPGH